MLRNQFKYYFFGNILTNLYDEEVILMMNFIRLADNKEDEKLVKALYNKAFPVQERMPYFILKYKSKKGNADFFKIYDDSIFVGLCYCVFYKDILYIFYLAVDESRRGKGYGSRVLQYIEEKYSDYRIILNIEEVTKNCSNYEQRLSRKAFYQKNGFFALDYNVKEGSVVYENLCCNKNGEGVSKQEYFEMMKSFFGGFYIFYKFFSS